MSGYEFLVLVDGCMCTNIRKVSRISTRLYDKVLEPSGLNINQLAMLLTIQGLEDDPDQEPTIGDIADRLAMDKSTLSRNIMHLEKAGIVEIGHQPGSRLHKQVKVTEHGITMVLEASTAWEAIQNRIKEQFSNEKFAQVISLLGELETLLYKELEAANSS